MLREVRHTSGAHVTLDLLSSPLRPKGAFSSSDSKNGMKRNEKVLKSTTCVDCATELGRVDGCNTLAKINKVMPKGGRLFVRSCLSRVAGEDKPAA